MHAPLQPLPRSARVGSRTGRARARRCRAQAAAPPSLAAAVATIAAVRRGRRFWDASAGSSLRSPTARRAADSPSPSPACISTMSGIGEGARLAYDALEAAGMTPAAFDISAAFGQAELDAPPRRAHDSRIRRNAGRSPQRAVPAACLVGAGASAASAAAASSAIGRGNFRAFRTPGCRAFAICTKSGCRANSRASRSPPPPTCRCMSCRIRCRR